jgi:hypothetical protein
MAALARVQPKAGRERVRRQVLAGIVAVRPVDLLAAQPRAAPAALRLRAHGWIEQEWLARTQSLLPSHGPYCHFASLHNHVVVYYILL